MSICDAYNYRQISENTATAGLLKESQLSSLSDTDIEVVINLLPDDSEFAVAGEKEIIESQGIKYIYIPVDFADPQLEDYLQFKKQMATVGVRKLLIHCAANYRVSTFYSQYAQEVGLWSTTEAEEFVNSIWNPYDYPGWPEFLVAVKNSG